MKFRTSISALKAPVIVTSALFVAWFFVFGGKVLGPTYDDWVEESHLKQFLSECTSDELGIRLYSNVQPPGEYYFSPNHLDIVIDLKNGRIVSNGGEYRLRRGLLWQPDIRSVFSNVSITLAPTKTRLSIGEVSELRQRFDFLPTKPLSSLEFDPSRNTLYFAFYRGGELKMAQFFAHETPPEIRKIFLMIGCEQTYDACGFR